MASWERRPPPFSPLWFACRHWIFDRDGYTCQYCDKHVIDYPDGRPRLDLATVDHVRPLGKGGLNSFDNLVTACWECNSILGDYLDTVRGKRWYIRFLRGMQKIRVSVA